ncbi:MAG: fibronectin type III domain-containing protein [Bacteroidales bacterium]|nr:fibronectin type III domain-containing protein [Bacteroidales bacterium]
MSATWDTIEPNIYSYIYNSFLLDNVKLKVANPCPTPQHVQITHTTATSVTASWDYYGNADPFLVFTRTPGNSIQTTTHSSTQTITINNLTPDTEYELLVIANCAGAPTSPWASNQLSYPSYPVQFRTLCAPLDTLPFIEDFESVPGIPSSTCVPAPPSTTSMSSTPPPTASSSPGPTPHPPGSTPPPPPHHLRNRPSPLEKTHPQITRSSTLSRNSTLSASM